MDAKIYDHIYPKEELEDKVPYLVRSRTWTFWRAKGGGLEVSVLEWRPVGDDDGCGNTCPLQPRASLPMQRTHMGPLVGTTFKSLTASLPYGP